MERKFVLPVLFIALLFSGCKLNTFGAPENLKAQAVKEGIQLTWDAVDGADYYYIYRESGSYSYYYSYYQQTSGTAWTDKASSLEIGETYTYQVSAYTYGSSYSSGQAEESDRSDSVSFTWTGQFEDSFNLQITAVSGGVKLSWSGIDGADAYQVRRSTSYSYSYSLLDSTTETTYIDTTASGSYSSYYYKIIAVSPSGAKIEESSPVAYTESNAPKNLRVTEKASSSLTLSWDSVSSASSYKLYRSEVSAGSVVDIGERITDTAYTDTGLTSGTRYYYKVSAILSSGSETEKSASVNAMTATQ